MDKFSSVLELVSIVETEVQRARYKYADYDEYRYKAAAYDQLVNVIRELEKYEGEIDVFGEIRDSD